MSRLPEMALSTNMLYDAALVPNIGLKLNVADHWNVGADWMTAWWSNRESADTGAFTVVISMSPTGSAPVAAVTILSPDIMWEFMPR